MTTMVTAALDAREIQLKDAKARLSAVVDAAMQGEPSIITRHGKPQAVVLGYEEWQRLLHAAPNFARLLMALPIDDGDAIFERDQTPPREVEF
ncbi:MAG: type II toxin-antitoxin system Phd/YefM family antitoxin [Alphaproteobacteria bacterium]|nr:type II toxin-antitoxin system Phd/YefM family antitoxin [Alphaproteobacteria bacterium]